MVFLPLSMGDSQSAAVSGVQALALRVIAERLEHGEAGPGLLSISFNTSMSAWASTRPRRVAGGPVDPDGRSNVSLLDMAMPGLSGLDTLKALRAAARRVPVIMVSGVCNAALGQRALAAGALDCVLKPIDPGYLLGAIDLARTLAGWPGPSAQRKRQTLSP